MAHANSNSPAAFLPQDYGELLIATATPMSVALTTTHVVMTANNKFNVPVINEDVSATWVDELDEIALDDAGLSEVVIQPRKIAALSKVSNELINDSTPAASEVVGQSIARGIADGIDAAFFGNAAGTGTQPAGIGTLTDAAVTLVEAGAAWANVDPFTEAVFAAENVGATLTAFIANPADAKALAVLKRETGSNEPLLSVDATAPTRRRLAGVDLHTSKHVPVGTVYGIDSSRVYTVMREGVEVELDRSVYFTSYATGIRGVARVAFGFPHAKSITRVKLDG